jgi:SRSO17 transposase
VAAGHSVELDPARWQKLFDQLMGRVAGRFARVDLRRRARAFVRGLLADLPRKNCWTIAEHAGDPNPDGMQHLLARAVWDEDKLATTSATTWSPTLATPMRRWSSTRPGT